MAVAELKQTKTKLVVEGDPEGFTVEQNIERESEGIELIHLTLKSGEPKTPPSLKVTFFEPIIDLHASWSPMSNGCGEAQWRNGLETNYYDGFISKATMHAPIKSYFSFSGENRVTYALSDALTPVMVRGGVDEPTADIQCGFHLFQEKSDPLTEYSVTLRIDRRPVFYSEAIEGMVDWWAEMEEYSPLEVPEEAKLPLYSSWYTFHKNLTAESMEEQMVIAKDLGFKAVILDDGWQHSGTIGGYHTASDWTAAEDKFPDMKAHVGKAHEMGLKYMIWYALPFLGVNSANFEKFKNMTLDAGRPDCLALDPRYPEVRELLISSAANNLKDYDIDGFKFDFIDSIPDNADGCTSEGMDIQTVMAGFDALMVDMISTLKAIKPEILVEFRQQYNGPLMRKYANIMRAKDCANDSFANHIRTIDARLTAGNTVVHSDMLMWNYNDTAESAAKQILFVLFSVPQISRKLQKLKDDHFSMLKFWLNFWMENRDVLMEGKFMPHQPEAEYPLVVAENLKKRVIALYYTSFARVEKSIPESCIIINATSEDYCILELKETIEFCEVKIFDTCGREMQAYHTSLNAGLHRFEIPESGLMYITGKN